MDASIPNQRSASPNRKRAALAVAPLLAVGLLCLGLLFTWGLNPLWGFAILPPMLMTCTFAWIYFSADHETDGAESASKSS